MLQRACRQKMEYNRNRETRRVVLHFSNLSANLPSFFGFGCKSAMFSDKLLGVTAQVSLLY
jgi:hypothetical protein